MGCHGQNCLGLWFLRDFSEIFFHIWLLHHGWCNTGWTRTCRFWFPLWRISKMGFWLPATCQYDCHSQISWITSVHAALNSPHWLLCPLSGHKGSVFMFTSPIHYSSWIACFCLFVCSFVCFLVFVFCHLYQESKGLAGVFSSSLCGMAAVSSINQCFERTLVPGQLADRLAQLDIAINTSATFVEFYSVPPNKTGLAKLLPPFTR